MAIFVLLRRKAPPCQSSERSQGLLAGETGGITATEGDFCGYHGAILVPCEIRDRASHFSATSVLPAVVACAFSASWGSLS